MTRTYVRDIIGKIINKEVFYMRKAPRTIKVKSHVRKNGEAVKNHKRSKPDGIKSNNHSYNK